MRSAASYRAGAILDAQRLAREARARALDDEIAEATATAITAIRAASEETLTADLAAAVTALKSSLAKTDARAGIRDGA